MRRILLVICVFLAACSPVVVTVPAGGDVLPAQAQRIIDQATATAAVVATQAAQATADEVVARATSTTGALQTRDALVVKQTQVALQLTSAAGAALATDGASVKTQAAGQTAAWSTPTAAAIRTQAAIDEREQQRRQASADSAAEFWRTLRATLNALLQAMVEMFRYALLALIVLAVLRALTQIFVFLQRQKAIIAREAFRILAPGHWAEWDSRQGYQVYPLPGNLDAPPVLLANPAYTAHRAQAWRHALRLFTWWGDRYGFGLRDLGPAGAGVVTDPVWRKLSRLLKDAGVLAEVPVPGQKGKVTTWADPWDFRTFCEELGGLQPPLTFPTDEDAPEVRLAVPTQHHSLLPATQQHSNTEAAVE